MEKNEEDNSQEHQLEVEKLHTQLAGTEEQTLPNLEALFTQEQVTTFLESITDGFLLFDYQWHVLCMNKKTEEFLQIQRDELIGKVYWDVFPDAVNTIGYRELHRAVADQVAVSYEQFYPPLDTWFKVRGYPSRDGISVLFIDVTERKKMEHELRKAHDELEKQFYERTVELAQINEALQAEIEERKFIEKKLQDLAKFPSENPNPVLRVAKDGAIIYANQASKNLLNEWDFNLGQLLPENLRHIAREVLASGSRKICEIELGDRTFSMTFSPVVDPGYVNIYGEDSTQRKKVEEGLKKREEMYRLITETAIYGIFQLNSPGEMVFANKAFCNITGYSLKELLGNNYQILIDDHDLAVASKYIMDIMSGKHLVREITIKHRNGHKVPISVSAVPIKKNRKFIGLTGILQDITKQKQAENALKESEERYKNLFKFTKDGILVSGPDGKLVSANPAASSILGYQNPDEMLGIPEIDLYADRELRESLINEFMEKGFIKEHELFFKKKDGILVNLLMSGFGYKDKKGNIIQLVGTFKDITEQKKIEEIHKENEALIYANKVKSEFMAIMSHELRTPLTSIIGYSKLLEEKIHGELNEKQQYYVKNILTGGNHLLDLINSILDIASLEAGKLELVFEPVPVADTVEEVVNLLREEAKERNIILKKEMDQKLDFITVDRQKFKQIMFNLLSNAIKFSKEKGGTITITTKKDGNMAKISVADTGIGIKKKDMNKLFHRFEQLDSSTTRKYEGTGLGLSITKELIELHGGQILVESKFRKGSIFTILLPIKTESGENSFEP